jgi:hypothetical protein
MIIPADIETGGAIEAGVPEFLDLIASENKDYQLQLGGGIMWLDSTCIERYGQTYISCIAAQQEEILDLIAFGKNGEKDPRLGTGIDVFLLCAGGHGQWLLYWRNRHKVSRLYRGHLPEGISRPAGNAGSVAFPQSNRLSVSPPQCRSA